MVDLKEVSKPSKLMLSFVAISRTGWMLRVSNSGHQDREKW